MRLVSWFINVVARFANRNRNLNKLRSKKIVDELALQFYYRLNTGKEVIQKYMSSNHSEVAET
jgi:hypothetical protein